MSMMVQVHVNSVAHATVDTLQLYDDILYLLLYHIVTY